MDRGGPSGAQMGQPAANAGMQRGNANLNALFMGNQASTFCLMSARHTLGSSRGWLSRLFTAVEFHRWAPCGNAYGTQI
jgi:hypothetical protein